MCGGQVESAREDDGQQRERPYACVCEHTQHMHMCVLSPVVA